MTLSTSPLVIDCHGHFTAEPPAMHAFRAAQLAFLHDGAASRPAYPEIAGAALHDAVTRNQLRLQQDRGTDVTLLSPRAAGMGHHIPDLSLAMEWAQVSNDAVATIAALFPENFAPVCQLPQTVADDLGPVIAELERCAEAGFVACNVNPDPSGGHWTGPPITDPSWSPLWSALERLRMPAMIHVSASCAPAVQTTGAHYLAADTIAFMQLLTSDLFERHPDLRLVIPHGGGAVPYHWGRFRGLAQANGKPADLSHVLGNVFFDTCVYHRPGIALLLDVVPRTNVLFGSELLGAVRGDDPDTGHPFDDTRRYIDAHGLDDADRDLVFSGNARRVYPLLDERLRAQGR